MGLLSEITRLWMRQIHHAKEAKGPVFGETAKRAWEFLGKNYEDLYIKCDERYRTPEGHVPYHQIRINKSREYVSVMLPFLHHRVPNRLVEPARPKIPPELLGLPPGMVVPETPVQKMDRVVAWQLQWFLNWNHKQYDLRYEGRRAIPEALVKGRGVVWHEMFRGPTGLIPGSFAESVDNLYIDPDAKQLHNASYIVRKRRRSVWHVSEEFGISREALRGQYKSHLRYSTDDVAITDNDEEYGKDIVEYYEVYSRMGFGHKFAATNPEIVSERILADMDAIGDNIYLVICPEVDYPLNLPPEVFTVPNAEMEVRARVQWPIAFYHDHSDPFPISVLDFYPDTDSPWASSPLEAALPLQIFLDHAYAWLMGRCRITCRDIIVASSSMDDELKAALRSNLDLVIAKIDGDVGEDLRKLVTVLQHPPVNQDIWQVLSAVEHMFERLTGMDPLLAGAGGRTQIRSSAEAQIRQSNVSNRPDDMAECVEDWMSKIAKKEAMMARLYVPSAVVAPLFGEQVAPGMDGEMVGFGPLSQQWSQLVTTDDAARAAAEMAYTVEAGTGRKKNKQLQMQNAELAMQTLAQPLLQLAQAGNPQPFNALIQMMAEANDMNLDGMLIPPPMMQPMMGQGPPQQLQGPPQ